VQLLAGIEIALPAPATLPVGSPVLVSIRPENITLADPDMPGTLAATVRLTLPLGAADVIEAALPGGETVKIHRTRSPASKSVIPGTPFGLIITDPTGIGLFAMPDSPSA
jgi:putative spermidine/putrescine transport system ATP-binding protein